MTQDANELQNRFIELKAQGRLPSIKGVALSILEATSNEDVSLGRIAQIVTPDPALTARLIKISNSALYPGSRPVASLSDAIQKLGLAQVRHVALSFALVSENKDGACQNFDYPSYWVRSILRGSIMRQTCLLLRLGSPEEMFTLGLLSKIGELALATAYPEQYSALLDLKLTSSNARKKEIEVFGIDAPTLSAALMEDWKLPTPFSEAMLLEVDENKNCVPRTRGLFALIKGAELVAQGWLNTQQITPTERLNQLTPILKQMLDDLISQGQLAHEVDEEQAQHLGKVAFEEAMSWLDSLSILPSLSQKRSVSSKPNNSLAPIEPKRPLTEEILQPEHSSDTLRALIGTADTGGLKTIAQALSMRSGKLIAMRSKEQLFDELIELAPHVLFIDFDSSSKFLTLLQSIRDTEIGKTLYIVILAKTEQESSLLPLLSQGIDDYLIKPISLPQAHAKLSTAEKFSTIVQSFKESKQALMRYSLELESANKKLQQSAISDSLTGLPNRLLMQDRLKSALVASKQSQKPISVLMIDLDNFKNINDSFGHPVGDELLRAIALKLKPIIKTGDSLARMGGDEFTVILRDCDLEQAQIFAQTLSKTISAPQNIHGRDIVITSSIGISNFPTLAHEAEHLIQQADLALYKAKQQGKAKWAIFHPDMSLAVSKRFAIQSALNNALQNNEFEVFFQPRIHLNTGTVAGAEALLRWNNPALGNIPPDIFIPLAEESGLIDDIGNWVLQQSLKIAKPWLAINPSFHLAVNISTKQFKSKDLAVKVAKALQSASFPAKNLELEVTESAAMDDIFLAAKILDELKKIGAIVSIDDFGTGHSSLAYLKKLPFNILKIDKSFILNALIDKDDMAICKMIAALAKTLGKDLVAEGVETSALASFAKEIGALYAQGYLYSKPVPQNQMQQLLGRVW